MGFPGTRTCRAASREDCAASTYLITHSLKEKGGVMQTNQKVNPSCVPAYTSLNPYRNDRW